MPRRERGPGALRIDAGWLDSLGPGELLPPSLARWRGLMAEGLLYFLNRLPPRRRRELFAAQLAIDPGAPAATRLVALLQQCPTLHKLGQVVARQPHLDKALRDRLLALESMPADADTGPLVRRLRATLDGASDLAIGATALAQGSVAVVLPFSWREGGRTREGVFKLLRPGVESRLADELGVLPEVATFLARRGAERDLAALDYADILDGVARLLSEEVRLDAEQVHLRDAAAFHAGDPGILVPRVLRWSAPWVTAMERVHGTPLADADLPESQRPVVAEAAIAALLARPFWTTADPAVFHGDLHGGNLLLTTDGRLAVLDWALTARVSKRQREAVVAAVIGGLTLDVERICNALLQLGDVAAGRRPLADRVGRSLDQLVARGQAAGFQWLITLLDELALDARIQFDPQLSVFRKTWMSLSGVLADVAGQVFPDAVLGGVGLLAFLSELPARWLAPLDARAFATHVSNVELAAALFSAGFTGLRYAQRLWRQPRLPAP